MWKIQENQIPRQKQEIEVKSLLKEMCEFSYASYAQQFEDHFKELVKGIPKSNAFKAENLFKVTHRNQHSVEVWKMTVDGDFKTKMWTLTYQKS